MAFDLAIIETGNGGDLQLMGGDLAVVRDIENMPYLGMFGGNKEVSVDPSDTITQDALSVDWWGNNLLMPSNQSQQFNSLCEQAFNTIPLTSSGRQLIQNKIIKDLQFLQPQAKITVTVTIVATDQVNVDIIIKMQRTQIVTIKFKKTVSGDFSPLDFNSDFLTT